MSTETNPVMTIPRAVFALMRQKCLILEGMEKDLVQQNERVKELENYCNQAERAVLQAEVERYRLMLQIFEDSPSLTTSLLLTQKARGEDFVKGDNCPQKLPPDIYSPVLIAQPEINANFAAPPVKMPLNSGGVSKFLFNKLSVELWITKKNLIAALKERDTPKINILERQEYEEIIRRLDQDLLTLRHQYAQIRLAAHTHDDPDSVMVVVGELQDKVRNQEKVVLHQQAMLSRLFPGTASSSGDTTVTPRQDSLQPEVEQKPVEEAQSCGLTNAAEPGSDLIEARKVIRELKLKCQRLGGEYREKLERLQGSEFKGQLPSADVSPSPEDELIRLQDQVEFLQKAVFSLNKEKDLLTGQLTQVRGEMSALNDRHHKNMAAVNDRHQQNMAAVNDRHQQDMAAVNHRHQQDMTALKDCHHQDMNALKDRHHQEMSALKGRLTSLNDCHQKEIASLNDSHQLEMDTLQEDKIQSQRIIDQLSEQVKTTRALLAQYEERAAQLLRVAPNWSTCGQEVPASMPSVLLSRGLYVDGKESLDGWAESGKEGGGGGDEVGVAKEGEATGSGAIGDCEAGKLGDGGKHQRKTEPSRERSSGLEDDLQQLGEQESAKSIEKCPRREPSKNS